MMHLLKNKGSVFSALHHNEEEQRHAEKIKNIERMIIADFKIFYQGVFYGFSKRKSVKSRRVGQSHNQRQSGGG
ncbi:hypothetical protein TH0274_13120 [Helicobacter pylori]